MTLLSRFSIRRPRTTLVLTTLALLAAAPGLLKLRLRTDGHALVPQDAPEVLRDAEIRARFGLRDTIVLMIRAHDPNGIYNAYTIKLIDDLTNTLAVVPGISREDLFSLATEKGHRVRTGTLQFLRLLDPLPDTAARLTVLRDDIQRVRIYNGTLVSRDESAAAIFIDVPPDADREDLYRHIQRVIADQGETSEEILVTGAPVAESLLGTHILQDLGVPSFLLGAAVDRAPAGVPMNLLDRLRFWIAHHVGLLPIALGIMTLVFFVCFRSLAAALMTLGKMGCCLLFVFGVMGYCNVPIYLTIAVMPVVLTAIGVAEEVHLLARYARELGGRTATTPVPHSAAVTAVMADMSKPVIMTAVTTAFGFLSFSLSPLGPVPAFGYFTGLGVIICLFWSLTVTPALLVLLPERYFQHGGLLGAIELHSGSAPLLARLAGFVLRRRIAVLGLLFLLLAATAFGIRRIRIQDSWIDGFAPASAFHRATKLFNDQFLGMHILFVCADTGGAAHEGRIAEAEVDHFTVKVPRADFADPAALVGQNLILHVAAAPADRVSTTTQPLAASRPTTPGLPGIGHHAVWIRSAEVQGDRILLTFDKTAGSARFNLSLAPGSEVSYEIAPQRLLRRDGLEIISGLEKFLASCHDEKVGGALGPACYVETTNFLANGRREDARCLPPIEDRIPWVWSWYENLRGIHHRRAAVDDAYAGGVISVFMNHANFVDTARLLEKIRAYEREQLAPKGVSLSFAGDVAVSQTLIAAIVSTQVQSLLLSIFGVAVVTIALNRSLKWGFFCVIPCALAVPLAFALMGAFDIPLGVATSMFAAMTIGIADDFAIHLVQRCRQSLAAGFSIDAALVDAVANAGPPILVDALGVGLGFSVLTLSQVPANTRLGFMVLTTLAICLLLTLVVLPAVIRVFHQPHKPHPVRST